MENTIVVRVWLRGASRDIGFCSSKMLFDNVAAVRTYLAALMKADQVLEFAGCGYHMTREEENGRRIFVWSVCKWLE